KSVCVDSPTPTGTCFRGRMSLISRNGQFALRTSAVNHPAEPPPTIATDLTSCMASRDASMPAGDHRPRLRRPLGAGQLAGELRERRGCRSVLRKVDHDAQMGLTLRDVHAVLEVETPQIPMDDGA